VPLSVILITLPGASRAIAYQQPSFSEGIVAIKRKERSKLERKFNFQLEVNCADG
jgi:hypothetical protein